MLLQQPLLISSVELFDLLWVQLREDRVKLAKKVRFRTMLHQACPRFLLQGRPSSFGVPNVLPSAAPGDSCVYFPGQWACHFQDGWRMEKVANLKSDQLAPFFPFFPSALSAVGQNLAGLPGPEAQAKGFRVMRRIPVRLFGRRKMPRCLKGCAHSYWRSFE